MALQRVETDAIQDDAVTTAKIAPNAIAAADIAADAITNVKVAAGAAIAVSKITGLGTAATLTAGTAANNVVQLDGSGRLPAVSGANLTGVSTDTSAMENNIAILAFKTQTANNLAKFNLVDQVVDEYKDDAGLATKTNTVVTGSTATAGYISSAYSVGGGLDSYTKLLLHMDDTGLTDSSASPLTTSKVGNVTRSGTQSKFGSYSAYFDGAGDELNITAGTAVNFANADWTVDFWWRPNAVNAQMAMFAGATDNTRIALRFADDANNNQYVVYIGGIWSIHEGTKTDFAANTWYHYACTRHNDVVYQYHNGVSDMNFAMTAAPNTESNNIRIGRWGGGQFPMNGYLDEYRVSIGISRYPSGTSFSVPTAAYSALSEGVNATGLVISTANTALTAPTTGDICMLIENASGTATLNTDLKAYVSRNGGTGWDQATLVDKGSWGTNKKILTANNVAFSNSASGTDMRYKIEWANQASGSKVTRVHATSLAWA